ncbi:MAG: hypothetical protein ACPG5W_01705 [Flavobacteriales bacterium]
MKPEQFINDELNATAKRMTKRMIEAAQRLGIGVTGSLVSSIKAHVRGEILELYFNNSGRFRDMGVGRGVTLKEVKALGRKPGRLYSKPVYSEVGILIRNLSSRYVDEAVNEMKELNGLQIQV